jgi:serine/threonine protein kinase
MEPLVLDQLVGHTVSGYRVEQLLSHGHLNVVYRAHHLRPNRSVALTLLLLPEEGLPQAQQQFRTRFLREVPRLIEVRHPNLLPVYDYGVWEGFPYLITAPETEGSLEALLVQRGPYTPEVILTVLEQITAGLEYAHRHGLVHGMLTPAHLLVSQERPLQIAGLGLLRLLERRGWLPNTDAHASVFTLAGTQLVTSKYLAPEYLQGHAATIRSDVYSLGVILLELLSGLLSVRETDPQERIMPWEWGPAILEWHEDMLPHSLKQVLRCALASDPQRRFQRVSDLLAAWASGVEEQEAREMSNGRTCTLFPVSPLPAAGATSPEAHNGIQEVEMWAFDTFTQQWSPTKSSIQAFPSYSHDGSKRRFMPARHRNRISRRRVTALLVASLSVGVIGVGSIKVVSLMNAGMSGQSSPAGSVIGRTSQALNSAQAFNQPGETEQRQRLLIHLPSGAFVAYKQGCTHSGVLVAYDPQTHTLVCPAHGAIFDPAQGGRVLHGPATRPLPQVTIHVNSDGTITTR